MNYLKLIVDLHVNRTMTDQMQTYTYHKWNEFYKYHIYIVTSLIT